MLLRRCKIKDRQRTVPGKKKRKKKQIAFAREERLKIYIQGLYKKPVPKHQKLLPRIAKDRGLSKKDEERKKYKHQKSLQKIADVRALKDDNRKKLEDDILGNNRDQSVANTYFRRMSDGDCVEHATLVDTEVFRQPDQSYLYIKLSDIVELFTHKKLDCGILALFEMSLYYKLKEDPHNKVGFFNPGVITEKACSSESEAIKTYLTQALVGYDFYLAPYLQSGHYVLFIICPDQGIGFILDSKKTDEKTDETYYSLTKRVNLVVPDMKWKFPDVNRQPGLWECGYYVMKWMNDFVFEYQNKNFPDEIPWSDESPFSSEDLNKMIDTWFAKCSDYL